MNWKTRFLTWLAWKLPKNLVYWCAMRVMTDSDKCNKYPMEQTCGDVIKKWNQGGSNETAP